MNWIKDHFSSRYIIGLATIAIVLIGTTGLRFGSLFQRFRVVSFSSDEVNTINLLFQRYTVIEVASLLLVTATIGLVWFLIIRPISEDLGKQIDELEINQIFLEEQNKIFIEQNQYLSQAIEISKELAPIQDPGELISRAVELIKDRYNLYHAQIYLREANNRTLALRTGSGDVGRELVQKGHRLLIGSGSISGTAAQRNESILVPDTKLSHLFVPNPLLPNTRSAMSIPLSIDDDVLGILNLQSDRIKGLNKSIQNAIEGMSGQLAAALQNANRFVELEKAQATIEEQAAISIEAGWKNFQDVIDRGEDLVYAYAPPGNRMPMPPSREELGDVDNNGPMLMATSILVSGVDIGTIQIETPSNRIFNEDDVELLRSIADQLGKKVENLRLFMNAQQYRERAEMALKRDVRDKWEAFSDQDRPTGYVFDGMNLEPINPAYHTGNGNVSNGGNGSEKGWPLLIKGESVGEIIVENELKEQEAAELIEAVTDSLSIHLENLRLSEQTEQRVRELSLINSINEIVTSGLDFDLLIRDVGEKIRLGMNATSAFITLYDKQRDLLTFPYYEIDDQYGKRSIQVPDTPFGEGLSSQVILNRETMLLRQTNEEDMKARGGKMIEDSRYPPSLSFLGAPMIAGNEVLGAICVQNAPDRPAFDDDEKKLLTSIANSMAVALQNVQLFSETEMALSISENRRRELQAVNAIVSQTMIAATFEEALNRMTEQLIQVLEVDLVTISQFNPTQETVTIVHERDNLGMVTNRLGQTEQINAIPAQQEVIENQKYLLIENLEDLKRGEILGPQFQHLRDSGASSLLMLPMLGLSGALGTVALTLFGETEQFSDDKIRLAETIVYQTSTVLENKQLLADTHARALREQKVRSITDKIRRGGSRDEILQIAKREINSLIEFSKNRS